MAHGGATPGSPANEVLRLSERTVETYLEAADAAGSEEAMRRLQTLAALAISRAGILRRIAEEG
jgi:hypothetical protein